MSKLRVGAQLIIWGQRVKSDLVGVLDEVSSLGYEGIECGTDTFNAVSDAKGILESRGLSLAGFHTGIGAVSREEVEKALSTLEDLGGRYLIFSGAGGRENSDENYLKNSKRLDEYGRLAMERGIKVCYHNHWQEIVNDERGIRLILENTDPRHVSLCVDTYWVKHGGGDPLEFIRKHKDRVVYLHLKDGTVEGMRKKPPEFVELGRGVINFPEIIEEAKSLNVEWVVVEQDRTSLTPKESMAISRRYLKEKFRL
ncbi:sugar phosphate isomerase/epimerase [Candidatus Bathyarchaeota archaeon]|nr:MAG: sugar phosphate isomerase/epimerase [Candidatus Bathyarchaeota archaeon]